MINIKVDPVLKGQAQKVAQALGLPLGTIINGYLRNLVQEKRVVFSMPLMPNKKTQALLKSFTHDLKRGIKNFDGPFTPKEALDYLDAL